jgi:hypothetical protein
MRQIKKGSIALFVCFIMTISFVQGATEPSVWAKPEVDSALQANIVPQVLRQDYQQNIKRYEYVLLALEIYESTFKTIEVEQEYPFYDIHNHPYEEAIVKAHAAGIVKGNGDGTFNPDGEITRQEVTSLVVNLIKSINPSIDVMPRQAQLFADQTSISAWAINYIKYCYESGIMKGVGIDVQGNPKINPQGKTTREEAIILLYRLFNNDTIMRSNLLGPVFVVDPYRSTETERVLMETKQLDRFANRFDMEVARQVKVLSQLDQYTLLEVEEDYINIEMPQEATMSLYESNGLRLYSLSYLLYDTNAEAIFKNVVTARIKDESIWPAFTEIKALIASQQSGTIRINDQYTFIGQVDEENANVYYVELREKN